MTNSHKPDGTGLRLDGYPTDENRFFWITAQESCHPKAAQRILNRIRENSYDLLTVMNRLNFEWLRIELGKIGVTMTFIEPQKNWTAKYDDGDWPKEALPKKIAKFTTVKL